MEKERGQRQGLGLCIGVELCFSQDKTLQRALEHVNAEGRHAVTSFVQHLRRKLRQQAKLFLGEIHGGDEPLLRSAGPRWDLLRELEYRQAFAFTLLA